MTLAGWLASLRARLVTASVTGGTVTLHGPATGTDLAYLGRYHDALVIGAAGTHPSWWSAVASGTPVDPEWLPDLGCAVVGCDGELTFYSSDVVPYCERHDPEWWAPSVEVAA